MNLKEKFHLTLDLDVSNLFSSTNKETCLLQQDDQTFGFISTYLSFNCLKNDFTNFSYTFWRRKHIKRQC